MTSLPRMKVLWSVLTMALGLVEAAMPFSSMASEQTMRALQGVVVAINVTDLPQVIVVKSMTAKKQELIVGAVVEAGTVITRGSKKVGLDNVKPGESVVVTYVKNEDGLVARSIHVR